MEEKEYIEYNGFKIDTLIFTQGFVPGCDVIKCFGQCCDWGVYMDLKFKDVILQHRNDITAVMDEEQIKNPEKWFEDEIEKDTDFPSGYSIGTETYTDSGGKTGCIFKDKNNYCSIQNAAIKKGMHKWSLKPKYCIMYPLTVVDGVLTYDDTHSKRLNYCGIHKKENFTQTVFEAMQEEIIFIFGKDCYDFLKKHFENNYK
jgi:hypothetical protein